MAAITALSARDLSDSWAIDVAAELDGYLAQLEAAAAAHAAAADPASQSGGGGQLNFAEAALLLQNSTTVYAKKVDYLRAVAYETLADLGRNPAAENAAGRAGAPRSRLRRGELDLLSTPWDLLACKPGTLEATPDELAPPPALLLRVPAVLRPRTNADDFLLASGGVCGDSGVLLVNPSDRAAVERQLAAAGAAAAGAAAAAASPAPVAATPFLEPFSAAAGAASSLRIPGSASAASAAAGGDDGPSVAATGPLPAVTEEGEGAAGAVAGARKPQPAPPAADLMRRFDCHAVAGRDRPLKVGNTTRALAPTYVAGLAAVPAATLSWVAAMLSPAPEPGLAAEAREHFADLGTPGEGWEEMLGLEEGAAGDWSFMRPPAPRRRRTGGGATGRGGDAEGAGDADDAGGGAAPAADFAAAAAGFAGSFAGGLAAGSAAGYVFDLAAVGGDFAYGAGESGVADDADDAAGDDIADDSLADAAKGGAAEPPDLHAALTAAAAAGVAEALATPAAAAAGGGRSATAGGRYRRIQAWRETVSQWLEVMDGRGPFDVLEYKERVREKYAEGEAAAGGGGGGKGAAVPFAELVRGEPRSSVCRLFLTALLMCNERRAEISAAPPPPAASTDSTVAMLAPSDKLQPLSLKLFPQG